MKFSIIKREPSYFFENIHEDLNRFLKDTFGDLSYYDGSNGQLYQSFRPAVEIKEKKNEYDLKIELPNIKKEDIDIELSENSISIKAQSKLEECKEDENIRTSEFRYGKFMRTIPFEKSVDIESAKCNFENGVLKIEVQKIKEEKEENVKKIKL